MNNLQATLLFPVRDAYARKQFLITSLVMLAGMIVPLVPTLIVMGYSAKIMRQVIDEGQEPSMPEWQGSDWVEMLKEGFRLWAVRVVYALPIIILMGCGFIFVFTSAGLFSSSSNNDSMPIFGGISFLVALGIFMLLFVLSLPLGIITGAAEAHAVTKQSFQASLNFKEWWPIFRKSLTAFLLAYVLVIAASMVITFAIQIAMITIVLICVMPFLMMGYTTYISLLMSTLFAQAYASGRSALQAE